MKQQLRITEIFYSIQGESLMSGLPTVFIRLTGCPLRCNYCDTQYAFNGGELILISSIIEKVTSYNCKHVTVTGGEPLAQTHCLELLTQLAQDHYSVNLETSGALSIEQVPLSKQISIVMDIKTPSSTESNKNYWKNISFLKDSDQIKFVIANRSDYQWSLSKILEYDLTSKINTILFSPSHSQLDPKELAEWILADSAPVRLQVQLHKYLWGNEPGK